MRLILRKQEDTWFWTICSSSLCPTQTRWQQPWGLVNVIPGTPWEMEIKTQVWPYVIRFCNLCDLEQNIFPSYPQLPCLENGTSISSSAVKIKWGWCTCSIVDMEDHALFSPYLCLVHFWMYLLSIAPSQIIPQLGSFRTGAQPCWAFWLFHRLRLRVAETAITSRSSVGSVHFQTHAHGCWQDSVPQGLLDWGLQVLVGFFSSCGPSNRKAYVMAFFWGAKHEEECKSRPKTEATTFCDLIWKVTCHHFWHILLVGSKLLRVAHTQGKGLSKGSNLQRQGSLGVILEDTNHQEYVTTYLKRGETVFVIPHL